MIPVVIGVPCAETARWSVFYEALLGLKIPEKSQIWQKRGSSVAENRNMIVARGLAEGAEYFFFLDDDQVFGPNVLIELLKHKLDAVVGLSVKREPPFDPLIYDNFDEKGAARQRYLYPDDRELIEIVAATSGGFLVHNSVFRAMKSPWWTLGSLVADEWCDDIAFCYKMKQAGFKLFCDTNVPFGHLGTCAVWPKRNVGKDWTTAVMKSSWVFEVPSPKSLVAI